MTVVEYNPGPTLQDTTVPDAPVVVVEVQADTATAAEAPEATTEQAGPVVSQVDPRDLVVEANVRTDVALTREFVGSIRQHGVLTPVLVHRTAEGLRVRAGQRRTLAAIEAGRPTIPAYIVDGDDDAARRIIEQMVENDHRAALGASDRIAGFQQLSLMGVSAATIAKRAGVKKATVTTALTVAASEVATAITARYDLTLDQAAVLAEFDGDAGRQKDLTVCAVKDPARFDHLAQQYRDDRAEQQAIAALTDDLVAQGITVVARPRYDETPESLTSLAAVDAEGTKTFLDPDSHAECPGRVAWIDSRYDGPVVVHGCADPKAHGHVARYSQGSLSTGSTKGKRTDEQKAERRTLIANNKAWKSAQTVRRTWLAGFAQRKTAPKDGAAFVAARLVDSLATVEKAGRMGGHALARTWLGLPERAGLGQPDPLPVLIATATPARAQHITLVLVLAAMEDSTGTHTWRNVTAADRDYFTALATWGYGLADVEAIVTAEPDPSQAPTDEDGDDTDQDAAADYDYDDDAEPDSSQAPTD
ncbi:ParB N-terminal domain-containing protein [uncultured Cellulomonas sp.]|uniref:ParB/RepB/Spo0J family partition protein n=1 Tax=uncultured Cellulomonas sp. TaxID=189682 RepID=UPI0026070C47|nr:ParB N-terminal domain-containing protein [uncultured Cellulomonas sp.]